MQLINIQSGRDATLCPSCWYESVNPIDLDTAERVKVKQTEPASSSFSVFFFSFFVLIFAAEDCSTLSALGTFCL